MPRKNNNGRSFILTHLLSHKILVVEGFHLLSTDERKMFFRFLSRFGIEWELIFLTINNIQNSPVELVRDGSSNTWFVKYLICEVTVEKTITVTPKTCGWLMFTRPGDEDYSIGIIDTRNMYVNTKNLFFSL